MSIVLINVGFEKIHFLFKIVHVKIGILFSLSLKSIPLSFVRCTKTNIVKSFIIHVIEIHYTHITLGKITIQTMIISIAAETYSFLHKVAGAISEVQRKNYHFHVT